MVAHPSEVVRGTGRGRKSRSGHYVGQLGDRRRFFLMERVVVWWRGVLGESSSFAEVVHSVSS